VPTLEKVAGCEEILAAQRLVRSIRISDVLQRYMVDLVRATRAGDEDVHGLGDLIEFGASPRATIAMAACARAHAFLDGRGYTLPEDVKAVAPDVLRHRILPTYEAEADGMDPDAIVAKVLDVVEMQ
jgi:MoxR-like ATPase